MELKEEAILKYFATINLLDIENLHLKKIILWIMDKGFTNLGLLRKGIV